MPKVISSAYVESPTAGVAAPPDPRLAGVRLPPGHAPLAGAAGGAALAAGAALNVKDRDRIKSGTLGAGLMSTGTLERSSRTAKTSALSAISAHRSASPGLLGPAHGGAGARAGGSESAGVSAEEQGRLPAPAKHGARRMLAQAAHAAPKLDMKSIPTLPPQREMPLRRRDGLFELEPAPVFYPTIEEFASPIEYIDKVAKEQGAREYGICKIVPPEGWRPPFVLDTESFRFKTRLMRLNSMEASSRAALNFLEQLYMFHRQQGKTGMNIPSPGARPLNLWLLRKEVQLIGGFNQVTNDRKWTTVARRLGYSPDNNSSLCTQLKYAYAKIILPYDDYVASIERQRKRKEAGLGPDDAKSPSATSDVGASALATPESLPGGRGSLSPVTYDKVKLASSKLNEALNSDAMAPGPAAETVASTSKKDTNSDLGSPQSELSSLTDDEDMEPGDACEVCHRDNDPDKIVLCDGCDRGYHLDCLNPPLDAVPRSQFYCQHCLVMEGADYGFDEGYDHSLASFQRRANLFKQQWLDGHPVPLDKGKGKQRATDADMDLMDDTKPQINGDDVVDTRSEVERQLALEDHIEREFWRLVQSQDEVVEVEYGADVNATRTGGGLPNLEMHPLDPYSRDGWNLNNFPILAGSLLRYIKSDVSGMTIPWIYVGMVFSTFAWHKEDHYTYSLNYHHWGDTKTWYGVPAADDDKLDAAMRDAAPELFEQQPDVMFQLVTLMSPGRLKEYGVRVTTCDQRPNEFVVTFPRAYHSGFNHGFNFNEAVNFALPDWLTEGAQCVKRYREIKKHPVFSHDELIYTIAQHDKAPHTSQWLLPHFSDMSRREMEARKVLSWKYPDMPLVVDTEDLPEEHFQCTYCHTLAYLTHIITPGRAQIACPEHVADLPANAQKTLHLRWTDDDLRAMLHRMRSRTDKLRQQRVAAAASATGDMAGEDELDELAAANAAGRTSGRKRKPSALAREAAGEDFALESSPATKRPRSSVSAPAVDISSGESSAKGDSDDNDDDEGDEVQVVNPRASAATQSSKSPAQPSTMPSTSHNGLVSVA